jgi:site-specific recombinase XerD
MRTLLTTIYTAGLRVLEAIGLKAGDIDSARMILHAREGNGHLGRSLQDLVVTLGELRVRCISPGVTPNSLAARLPSAVG